MRRIATYIHERPGWPEFTWDGDALAAVLAAVRHKQGRLLGRMEALGSTDTALRDIRELLERGIVVQNAGGGRSTSYRLAEPQNIRE